MTAHSRAMVCVYVLVFVERPQKNKEESKIVNVSGVNSKLSAKGFPKSLGVQSSMYAMAGKKKR